MLWIVFIAGIFLGANVGIVVTSMMVSAKKRDGMVHQDNNHIEYALIEELRDIRSKGSAKSSSESPPVGS